MSGSRWRLSCCGFIGDCMKQQGHFTSLQLKSMNQWTKQSVQTNALHDSSRGWHSIFKQIGHCNCSMIADVRVWKWYSLYSIGGAIFLVSETILWGLFFVGWPVVGVRFTCMACGDVGLQIWMKINMDTHTSTCSDVLVISQTLHSSTVCFFHS